MIAKSSHVKGGSYFVKATVFLTSVAFFLAVSVHLCISDEQELDLGSSSAEFYYSIGKEYMQRGKFDLAVMAFQKAVELSPNSAYAHNALGEAYFQVLRFQDALKEFEKALTIKSDYTEAKLNRMRTLRAIERYQPVKSFRPNIWLLLSTFALLAAVTFIILQRR